MCEAGTAFVTVKPTLTKKEPVDFPQISVLDSEVEHEHPLTVDEAHPLPSPPLPRPSCATSRVKPCAASEMRERPSGHGARGGGDVNRRL